MEAWDAWIESHYSSLSETFNKYIHPEKDLPKEIRELDKSRFSFIVISGRIKDFNENTYRLKRKREEDCGMRILHYDNIIDSAMSLLSRVTY